MDRLASPAGRSDRDALVEQTAAKLGRSPTVVEKDFWVCWTLSRLFGPLASDLPRICFKGGTSLSKVYGLIERFSEDIDLSLDRAALLPAGEPDPLVFQGSKNQRKRLVESVRSRAAEEITERILPAMREDFGAILGDADRSIEIDPEDPLTVLFRYPAGFPPAAGSQIKPSVRLEFGIGDQEPNGRFEIAPDVARHSPELFEVRASCEVVALAAGRTFWEKATILHEFYHRSVASQVGVLAISRHYYDLDRMAASAEADDWITDHAMRQAVVDFKQVYFARAAARYEEASPGRHLRLTPHDDLAADLQRDYEVLRREMIFGESPDFDELCSRLAELERRIIDSER